MFLVGVFLQVVYRMENGKREEPMEEVLVEVDDDHTGVVINKLSNRKAQVRAPDQNLKHAAPARTSTCFSFEECVMILKLDSHPEQARSVWAGWRLLSLERVCVRVCLGRS